MKHDYKNRCSIKDIGFLHKKDDFIHKIVLKIN